MSTSLARTQGDDVAQSELHQGLEHDATLEEEEEEVWNDAKKNKQRRNLLTHNVALRKSDTHGVGVFAIVAIPAGTAICNFNGPPRSSTIDWHPHEITELPEHVQETIKSFFLPNTNGTYSLPEHGLACTLGTSWYINSIENTGRVANVEFGNKKDESGYTEIVATRFIESDEELLLPYKLQDSARCMTTIDGAGRRDNLPEDAVPCCRVCQGDVAVNAGAGIVDIGCKCRENRMMCRECAVTWFTTRISFHFTQHRPDGAKTGVVVNEWTPDISVECELCTHKLSPSFSKILLREAAASVTLIPGLKTINERIAGGSMREEPVALKVSRVPGYRPLPRRHSKGSRNVSNSRAHERHQYSDLGQRSRQFSKRRSEIDDLQTSFIWQQNLVPGRFHNKRAQFWMSDTKKWVPGKIHEYVTATERNQCDCTVAVCSCPKYYKGMYRYTIDGKDEDEDYFSDDDVTVKVDGKTGKQLWNSP